jgi:hypothetical protein
VTTTERHTLAAFAMAFVAYVAISRYLLVAPETVVTLRNNVLFGTDSGSRLRYLTDPDTWAFSRLEFLSHPAIFLVWRPICQAFKAVFSWFMSDAAAAVLAAQIVTCGFAALGAAALHRLAAITGSTAAAAWFLPGLLVLATTRAVVVIPDHWAITEGLMLTTFLLLARPGRPETRRTVAIVLLAGLIAVTTTANAVFAVLVLVGLAGAYGVRLPKRLVVVAAGAAGAIGAVLLAKRIVSGPYVAGFFNFRLLDAPLDALRYAVFALIGPIIGPTPYQGIERQHVTLNYEPLSFGQYPALQWVAVTAWVCLLAMAARQALRDPDTRRLAEILLAWVGYNLLFHNLWGDEFFLYSAHWSWALVALVVLGARRLSPRWLIPLVIAVGLGQIWSLWSIGAMLRSS